ncbi:MAG: ABC transporter substrate-binding protein [Myxococcales bacterium]
MAPRRGTTRRDFLKTSALALASLGVVPAARAAPPLKLKKPIKIGCQTILSGPLGGYGEFTRKGAMLAMEEINAMGGIGGSPIELNFRDEELKVDVGVKNARYFVQDWGADFLIGIDSSAVALAVGEIMPSLNRILIVTHGATEKFNEDLVYKKHIKQCFRVSVPVYQDGIASAFIAKDLPVKRWATISPDYEYGHTSWKMFRATLKKLKPDVEFVGESFAKFGTVDFSSHISKVMGLSPEGIFSTEWGGEAVTMIKQAKLFKVFENTKAFMIGMGSAMDVLQGLGADYPDGVWASGRYYFGYPDTPENKRFVETFRKRWDSYPSYPSETSYTALYAIKKAVEKAGTLDIDPVIAALEGLELSRPAGPCVIRKEDHQAVYAVPWGRIRHDPKYPMPTLGDLRVAPTSEYYRKPPFAPVES